MTSVLLCDDDENNRLTTSALLEDEGFHVELAGSFAEAEGKLSVAGAGYALLILDQYLGDGLGSTLASLARTRLPAAKLVLLTGADHVDARGVDVVVRKGEGFDALLAAITGLLTR